LFLALGVGEHAVGLIIAVTRIGRADIGREEREVETGLGSGGFQTVLDIGREAERDVHPLTQPARRGGRQGSSVVGEALGARGEGLGAKGLR
jgi:hypothetical protein